MTQQRIYFGRHMRGRYKNHYDLQLMNLRTSRRVVKLIRENLRDAIVANFFDHKVLRDDSYRPQSKQAELLFWEYFFLKFIHTIIMVCMYVFILTYYKIKSLPAVLFFLCMLRDFSSEENSTINRTIDSN